MKTAKPAKPATTQRTATAKRTAAPKRTGATQRTAASADAQPKADALLPNLTRDALGEVTETLEFMWSATQAVFGEQAKPEHAIALLPYALDALEVRRLLAEEAGQQQSGSGARR